MSISTPRAALAGILAAAGGLGCAELVAGLLSIHTTPAVAVGAAFIDVVPDEVREFGIRLLGTADKPVLISGILVVLGLVAAWAGILAARSPRTASLVFGALALLGAGAAVTRPDSGLAAVLPALVAGAVAMALVRWLVSAFATDTYARDPQRPTFPSAPTDPSARPDPSAPAGPAHPPRRDLLRVGGTVAVGSLVAAGIGRGLGGRRTAARDARTELKLPKIPAAPVPAGTSLDVAGISPWKTPNDIFYRIDTALTVPLIEAREWRLKVHGMVDRPLELSLTELLRRKIVHRYVTLTCVSNEVGGNLAGNALWTGVPVADILAEAGVHASADAVQSTSSDGWTCGTPLSALTDGRPALLAFAMNGEPLPFEHGFPVRMVVPGLYGYVSATKWLVDIEVTRFDRFRAYWTDRGWSAQGPVKTASRIDVPRSSARVESGQVAVAGVAWAQHRGISRVEVRVDDGPWHRARLAGEPTKDSWRQWTWTWDATPGRHQLQVRATDGTGATQTSRLAPPAPDGASGWHTVQVQVG